MKNASLRGLAVLALLVLAPCARAISYQYTFTQAGYPEGAYVAGSLYVNDLNGDGVVVEDGPYGDSIGGHMRLIGHPVYNGLTVGFFTGSFNLFTLSFNASGDSVEYFGGRMYMVDGFIDNGRGGFADLPGGSQITSSSPVVLQRVPDALPVTGALMAMLLLLHFRAGSAIRLRSAR